MPLSSLRHPVPLALAVALGIAAVSAHAQGMAAGLPGEPAVFNLAMQPLSQALSNWALQTGVQLIVQPALVAGKTAPAVSGTLTPGQALDRLLAGSGLIAAREGAAVVIKAAPSTSGDMATLPLVTVTGNTTPPETYAGGQVARRGRLGMLGNVDVMEAPFNITNYTSQLMEDQQAGSVLDVLRNEPSIRESLPGGAVSSSAIKIRGFSVATRDATFDGLYGMTPYWGDLPTDFAERVEVLKGPSALLYGMSPYGVVGGSVNIVPKRAGDDPLTRLTLGVGSDSLWKGHVDMGRRFGANGEWGLRFNGSYSNGEGYIHDQKKEGSTGALALDYRGEQLRLTLDAYRVQQRMHGASPPLVWVGNGMTSMPAAPSGRTDILPGSPGSTETTEAAILGGEYDFNDRWTGYAKFGMQHGTMKGVMPGWISNLQANGDADVYAYAWPTKTRTQSAETGLRGRFQTGPVSHSVSLSASYMNRDSWVARATGSTQSTNIYAPAPILSWPVSPTDIPKASENTLSGVALADTLGFIDDRVLLTLGERRQHVKVDNFDANSGAVTSRYDASAWTPMAGLVVKPTDDLSLYANVIQGLSQGTTVGSTYQNAGEVFPPYKTKQVEVGAKLQTGSFTNTLSVFQIKQPSTTTDNSTSPLPTLRLDGEQRNRGIEWAIFGELTTGLRVLGGVTYLQGRLTKTQDGLYDGNQAPGSPPWSANLGLDWDVPGVSGLALNSRVIYTSAQYLDNANSVKLPPWTVLDLGARYATKLGGKDVVFRANVNNVFDKHYWGVYANGGAIVGAPRTFWLSASIDF
ncbi:TonB-dependent siderophore receptor [Achromobacter aloeverae]